MKRSAAITALVVSLGLLSACTPETEETPSPTPTMTTADPTTPAPTPSDPPTTTSPEPSPSPSPSETLDADQQAARDLVLEFYRVQDELTMDASATDLTPLMSITTGDAQLLAIGTIRNYREENLVHTEPVKVDIVSVGAPTDAASGKLVQVDACTDATAVDIIDLDTGKSTVSENRKPVLLRTVDVVQEHGIWLVSAWHSTPTEACP